MNSEPSTAASLLGLWMLLQLVLMLGFLLGGLYVLYCLNRAAAGMDRLASVAEAWLETQQKAARPTLPPGTAPTATPREYTPASVPVVAPTIAPNPPISTETASETNQQKL